MDTRKVSVVIPVYDVEKYLPECLDSLINQTYKNLEIILIDDGSTDSSGMICDQYASANQNIIAIHQKNQGVSSARNKGMSLASGDYISFIDPDDFLDCSTYATMIPLMQETGVDISFFEFYWFDESTPTNISVSPYTNNFRVLEGEKRISIPLRYSGSSCNCIYNSKLIVEQKFSEDYKLSEDTLFLVEALLKSRTTLFIKQKFYYRRQRQNSATRTRYNSEWIKLFETLDMMTEMLTQNSDVYKSIASYIFYTKTYELIYKLEYDYRNNSQDIHYIQTQIKQNYLDIKNNPYISKKGKFSFGLFCISPVLFYKLVVLYCSIK